MALVPRTEVVASDTWNLDPMYTDLTAWRSDYAAVEAGTEKVGAFAGTLGQSASRLREALDVYLNMSRTLEKVYVFAHLRSDEDTSSGENLGRLEQATNLYARVSELWSFLTPELLALPEKQIAEYLAHEELAPYRRMLREIVRYKPHTLSKEEERLLAAATEVFGTSEKVFSQLNNADLQFGTILVDGEEKTLSHGTYTLFLKHPDRDVRRRAFEQYYQVFDGHKNTIAATLGSSIKRDIFLAKAKNFPSARERSLFSDNVPTAVYDNLVDTVAAHLEPLHRYYELRRQLLKLDKLRIYDTYVPLVANVKTTHSYEEAAELVVSSLPPLGEEYVNILKRGLGEERWVDRYENKGKRSGAYSSGCYDSSPYILMNYKADSLNDVFTLAHEAGHSMHTYFSNRNQSYQDHGYTIFVAEVASTFNEQLLALELKKRYANDKAMLAYLINQQIDDIKSTLYRQTMFAEFERTTHALAEDNEPLTIDVLRKVYRELLVKYFGAAVEVSELDELECLRIPHFYSAFYVYKYATGLSAAIALSERVLNGGATERDEYLRFLKSGGSKYPLELLKDAGVDMTRSDPVVAAMKRFGALVDELGATLR
ncbi:MAG: oligoendopeptidase F [Bdellovibrionota bacterium]